MLAKILKALGYVWLTVAGIVILAGIVGVWSTEGFWAVTELLSPFNVANWFLIGLTLMPGFVAVSWAERIERRRWLAELERKD